MFVQKYQIKFSGQGIFQKFKNWITQEPLVFSPKKMSDFLKRKGYTKDGVNFYLIIEEKVRKFGIISIYDNVIYFSENDFTQLNSFVWEVPIESIKSVELKQQGVIPPANQYVQIIFEYSKQLIIKLFACPVVVKPFNVPSQITIDKSKTEELFKLLKSEINK